MVTALVLDPGKATGAAFVEWGEDSPLEVRWTEAVPGGVQEFLDWWSRDLLPKLPRLDLVICELFEIDGTITGTWSPRIEGALMAMWSGEIVWQRRDDKAALLPTEEARRAWFRRRNYRFKTSHELDAVTHALVYVGKRLHHEPTLRAWWPPASPEASAPAP